MIKNAFQILITNQTSHIPPLIESAQKSFQHSLPGHTYTLYNKEMIEILLKNEFNKDVLNAFKKLKPKAYKADLARYCIAYKYGGWYADITIKMTKIINLNDENIEFLGFIDNGNGIRPYTLSYPIQSSLFYASKKCKIMNKAIELILNNCKQGYYGTTPTSPTGPGVLGRAIAYYGLQHNQIIGHFMPLTPNHKNKNRSYILPDGSILALHKDAWMENAKPAQISDFGIEDGDNYLEMYKQNNIYNSTIF